MDLSITIVNTNHLDDTLKCLRSIYDTADNISFEIYVVNNACTDNSEKIISERFPQVYLINNKRPHGVSANFNKGFKRSNGRYLLMLNEDCIVVDNCLQKMIEFLDKNKTVGVASPQILNPDGSPQNQAYRFLTLSSEFITSIKTKAPLLKIRFAHEYPDSMFRKTFEPDWVGGVATFFRKEAFDKTGLLDERFFVFGGDIDICKRIREVGWSAAYFTGAKVIHKQGVTKVTAEVHVPFKKRLMYDLLDGKLKYFKKYFSKGNILILKCIILFDVTLRLIKSSLLYCFSKSSRVLFAILLDWLKLTITLK